MVSKNIERIRIRKQNADPNPRQRCGCEKLVGIIPMFLGSLDPDKDLQCNKMLDPVPHNSNTYGRYRYLPTTYPEDCQYSMYGTVP